MCSINGMTLFFSRFMGALALDASAFEGIEADRHAAMQSVLVVMMVCVAGGVAAMGYGEIGIPAFVSGAIISLGAWLVWAAVITTVGTFALPEPQTRSDLPELLRVLGFAAAPGVFIALAAMRAAAPLVVIVVSLWTIAAAVLGVRQALDYRSTPRALAVCVLGWLVSVCVVGAALILSSRNVS